MKQLLPFLVLSILLYGCGGGADSTAGKGTNAKQELKLKKDELAKMKAEISALEKQMEAENPKKGRKARSIMVTTDSVRTKNFEEYVELQGQIATKGNFVITAEIPGRITSLTVNEGDFVRKGQLIATIDNESFEDGEAELQVQLNLARDIYQRRKKLWDQKIGSEIEFLTAKSNVEALEKKMQSIGNQKQKAEIYSPSNGIVDRINIRTGELAGPGAPIALLLNTDRVQVTVDVPETYLAYIKQGDKVEVYIPSLEMTKKARITNMGSNIHPANRTFTIEAALSNSNGRLKPNLLCMVKLKKFFQKDGLVVKTNLIQSNFTEDYVYVVVGESGEFKAEKRTIERGRTYEGETLVLSGLESGEMLVAEGRNQVVNGSPLNLK